MEEVYCISADDLRVKQAALTTSKYINELKSINIQLLDAIKEDKTQIIVSTLSEFAKTKLTEYKYNVSKDTGGKIIISW